MEKYQTQFLTISTLVLQKQEENFGRLCMIATSFLSLLLWCCGRCFEFGCLGCMRKGGVLTQLKILDCYLTTRDRHVDSTFLSCGWSDLSLSSSQVVVEDSVVSLALSRGKLGLISDVNFLRRTSQLGSWILAYRILQFIS